MVIAVIALSAAIQSVAAWFGLRWAWRTRQPAWLALSLAVVVMLLRRSFTLYRAIAFQAPVDAVAESLALVVSVLMLAGIIGLGRSATAPIEDLGAAARFLDVPRLRTLIRTAFVLAGVAIAGGLLVGYHAHRVSREALLKHALESNLSLARVFAAQSASLPPTASPHDLLGELEGLWSESRSRYPGSYLCVVGDDGRLLVHTREPGRVGEDVSALRLGAGGSAPGRLAELLRSQRDWVGEYETPAGEPQIAAMAYVPRFHVLVSVHVPEAELSRELRMAEAPWIAALVLIVCVLVPLALGLLHGAYGSARAAARGAMLELRASEERLGAVVRSAPIVLFALDREGRFTLSEGRGLGALGLRSGEAIGRSVFEMYGDYPPIIESVRRALRGEEVSVIVQVEERWFEGRYAPLHADGVVAGVIGVAYDITEFKRIEGELVDRALSDPLTGLPNRMLFLDRLGLAIERGRRGPEERFAVLFLDLDRFKRVNDSLGHQVGDELLVATARKLETCLRPGDTLSRLGGDEFTILVDEMASEDEPQRLAERIQNELRAPFLLHEHEVFTTVSIGIAIGKSGYERPEDIVRDADTAMYQAKALGRARHVTFDPDMHVRAVELLRLETDLRRAVDRGEFRVHYQPIVSLATGGISGFEALVRWEHPERGTVLPDEFMRVAEETEIIVPIGRWVLRQACAQMREWKRLGRLPGLSVVVNLSGRQWARAGVVEEVLRAVEEFGLEPRELKLEITESLLIENAEEMRAMLTELRAREIHTCLDDFGTGYSSLSLLHRYPIDAIKVDRSFVSRIGPNGENVEIVRSIVSLGHHLGKYVIAEGIETAEQLQCMRDLDCEFGQGHLFAAPVDAVQATALLVSDVRW